MQKRKLDKAGLQAAYEECVQLGTEQMRKTLKTIFPAF